MQVSSGNGPYKRGAFSPKQDSRGSIDVEHVGISNETMTTKPKLIHP